MEFMKNNAKLLDIKNSFLYNDKNNKKGGFNVRYPEFLQPNGTIGLVAPSLACTTEPYISTYQNAQNRLSSMGYSFDIGPNCNKSDGIGISSSPDQCGEELNRAYLSDKNNILISCGGGEMMCEVVPYIDFQAIKNAKPKWFLGYSDNTNFTFTSTTLADTAAIYGPCISDFGHEKLHPAVQDCLDLLTGNKLSFQNYPLWEKEKIKDESKPLAGYNDTIPSDIKSFFVSDNHAAFKGRLVGGCVDCLINLLGTPYDKVKDFNEKYKEDGIIWFLECCDLNVFSIRRAMWQMKEAGWFQYVKGFLIGRPRCFGEEFFGLDHYRAVTDILGEYHVPILMDLDIGHMPPMIPIVSGAIGEVKLDNKEFSITYNLE